MSGKKIFYIDPENRPNRTTRERVVSERGRKELPPGKKGGENLKPDRHYEHKQYAFDSYCKKVLKCEACNGYRQISRRQKHFASLEELSEADLAQLAVYDRYSWEYTTFPVGGAVILIEDDRLSEALLGLSQEDREIFMMHWFLRMTDEQIAKYMDKARQTPHTMRHTFCTRLAHAGMNPKDLQYIMGHSNITMTLNYYAHADYASAKAAMDRLAA